MVALNRNSLVQMVMSNWFGLNAPAIAAVESGYEQTWARDVAAMSGYYSGASAAVAQMSPVQALQHMPGGLPGGLGCQPGGTAAAAGANLGAGNRGTLNLGSGNTGTGSSSLGLAGYVSSFGVGNSGSVNTGNGNSGNTNTGFWNSGATNTGVGASTNGGAVNSGFGNVISDPAGTGSSGFFNTASGNCLSGSSSGFFNTSTASVSVKGHESGFFNSGGPNPNQSGRNGYNSGLFNPISFTAGLPDLGSLTGSPGPDRAMSATGRH